MALTDSLISYYKLDEASGDALDAHATNDLTDTNTVGSATGIINNGRSFAAASAERFAIADNADFSMGDEDFSISAWVNGTTYVGTIRTIVCKGFYPYNTGFAAYFLTYNSGASTFQFGAYNGGGGVVNWSSTPSTGTWYHLVATHDATANLLTLVVNDGTPDTQSYSSGSNDDTYNFNIGGSQSGFSFDGVIDEVGIWNKVLSGAEITSLYNGGSGLAYPLTVGGGTRTQRLTLLGVG